MPDLLLELFSEEIPARLQRKGADDLKRLVTDGLIEAGLTYESAGAFSTPRRLVLSVEGLTAVSPTLKEERKGPRIDAPEKAIEGFLRSVGLTKDQLEVRDDKKGQVYFASMVKEGRPADEIIGELIPEIIRNFPWPKSMRWGAGSLRWVRPLHSILCVLSDEEGPRVVDFEISGIKSGNTTEGHRFMAPGRFAVSGFEDYAAKLQKAHVVLNPEDRAEHIWHDATQMAFAQGLEVVEDKGLLAEVAGLVEWPVVLMGDIGEAFLELPPEVLQTSMREHQKFFSVRNPKTGRIEKYITVANRETADHGAAILAGNGKVLAARLSDAIFFWENDLRTVKTVGLEGMAKPLEQVTFHNKLGTQAERIERIAALAREIAPLVGADPDLAAEGARVAKADLASEMVYEFPELQGIMGRYYAQAADLDPSIANACEMHWKPLGPSDEVPSEPVSVAVALADKIGMLSWFFWINEQPTGSKDPFALRRAALGCIRVILVHSLRIRLREMFVSSLWSFASEWDNQYNSILRVGPEYENDGGELVRDYEHIRSPENLSEITTNAKYPEIGFEEGDLQGEQGPEYSEHFKDTRMGFIDPNRAASDLLSFFADRLKVHLRAEGIRHDIIDACFQLGGQDDLVLLVNRVKALQTFLDTEDGANLLTGFKRANNILQAEEKKDGVSYELPPEIKMATQDEEKALFAALDKAQAAITPALEAEDFAAAMTAMASLRAPIDAFFDHVTVNADSGMVRRNRLCLLNRIREVMNQVAIFSAIEG